MAFTPDNKTLGIITGDATSDHRISTAFSVTELQNVATKGTALSGVTDFINNAIGRKFYGE